MKGSAKNMVEETFEIDQELYDRLEELADLEGITVEELGAKIIMQAFDQQIIEGVKVHAKAVCEPPCPFHAPSDHPLKNARIHLRADKDYLVERICEHGVGHDDPDSVNYMNKHGGQYGVHGCDGCCQDEGAISRH